MFCLLGRCGGLALPSFLASDGWRSAALWSRPPGGRDRSSLIGARPTLSKRRTPSPTRTGAISHDDLVQKPGLEALPGDVGAQDDDVRAIGSRLGERHRLFNAHIEKVPVAPLTTGGCFGGSWRSSKNGPRRRLRRSPSEAILDILGRPATSDAPVDRTTSSTVWSDPLVDVQTHPMSSSGPAMKPSRLDIVCRAAFRLRPAAGCRSSWRLLRSCSVAVFQQMETAPGLQAHRSRGPAPRELPPPDRDRPTAPLDRTLLSEFASLDRAGGCGRTTTATQREAMDVHWSQTSSDSANADSFAQSPRGRESESCRSEPVRAGRDQNALLGPFDVKCRRSNPVSRLV